MVTLMCGTEASSASFCTNSQFLKDKYVIDDVTDTVTQLPTAIPD